MAITQDLKYLLLSLYYVGLTLLLRADLSLIYFKNYENVWKTCRINSRQPIEPMDSGQILALAHTRDNSFFGTHITPGRINYYRFTDDRILPKHRSQNYPQVNSVSRSRFYPEFNYGSTILLWRPNAVLDQYRIPNQNAISINRGL